MRFGERAALWHSRHVPTRPTKKKARSMEQKRELALAMAREGWNDVMPVGDENSFTRLLDLLKSDTCEHKLCMLHESDRSSLYRTPISARLHGGALGSKRDPCHAAHYC